MSKKLYFLISFVLVLSLGGLAQADAIEVNNPSFEIGTDGNQIYGHEDLGVGWEEGGAGGFVGVDTFCPYAAEGESCHNWPASDGICYPFIQNVGGAIFQVLDMNNSDANAVIEAGRRYTLTFDSLAEDNDKIGQCCYGDPSIVGSLFYGDNPDANQLTSKTFALERLERAMGDCSEPTAIDPDFCRDWNYDLKVDFVAEAGQEAYLGKTLGIKFTAPSQDGDSWDFVDNVRLDWSWASTAYDPDPADEAEDVPIDVNLSWKKGLWAVDDVNGHEVYFGTDQAAVEDANTSNTSLYPGVYRGPNDVTGPDANNRYSYDVLETLELGKTYYWRIDEVNEGWGGGPVPPVNDRWKGDVWSFRTTGLAKAVYPADGAGNIPALNLLLRWTAGTDADGHDVYFGSDEAAVEDANTNTAGIYRGPTQALSDVNYLVEPLEVGKSYYWRIDEVNTATVKGDVWSFTTGVFLIVDSFEWYQTHQEIKAVWKDFSSGSLFGKNGAEVKLMTVADDANMILGGKGQSMLYYFRNNVSHGGWGYVGSEAKADIADLEIGSDWIAGGVKALVVNFYGHTTNLDDTTGVHTDGIHQDQMWVALEDGDGNEGIVQYPDMGDIAEQSWHTWNISLQDPCFSDVNIADVAKIYIGFGGQKIGQKKKGAGMDTTLGDTVWFDDIRLYPPRCLPTEVDLPFLGDFTEDCNTDYFDLELIAEDWASIDGLAVTENRPAQLTNFPAEPNWLTGFDGNNALEFDGVDDYAKVTDPRLRGLTSLSITAWVKHPIENLWVGIVTSREEDTTGATVELGIYGGGYGGPGGKTDAAVAYDWSNVEGDAWKFDAGLSVPDNTWTFIAMSVDPTGCTLYMQPAGGAMDSDRNVLAHPPMAAFNEYFDIGLSKPAKPEGFLKGLLDDVRIYGYNLDDASIAMLADETGEPNPPPVYWYKLDEASGLSAADSGTSIEVYTMNLSPANVVPKDPNDSEDPNLGTGAVDPNNLDIVNFLDYKFMAEHWLEQHPWP